MSSLLNKLTLGAAVSVAMSLAGPVLAQEATTDTATGSTTETATDTAANPVVGGLSTGQAVADERGLGQEYLRDTFGDWELRCVATETAEMDPCQLYQRLYNEVDGQANDLAEFSLFPLPENDQLAAGATVITPLATMLAAGVVIAVDASEGRRYPYEWCSDIGCIVRIGFLPEDITAFKRGAKASLVMVPVATPQQPVVTEISLTGFTDAFNAINEIREAQIAAGATTGN